MKNRLSSIRVQFFLALALFLALIAGTVSFTLTQLDRRTHDYVILNLAGQLRVTSHSLLEQSRRYLKEAPGDPVNYARDLKLFYQDLLAAQTLFEKIIAGFEARRLDVELTGRTDPITCSWDGHSRSQLGQTASIWRAFNGELNLALGKDAGGPHLIAGATYIDRHGDELIASTNALATAFQHMMEGKLEEIRRVQLLAIFSGLVLFGVLAYGLSRHVLRPLSATRVGFDRVAQGDFAHRVELPAATELKAMTLAFNGLAERINAIFDLNRRVNGGTSLDDTLSFVRDEFSRFLPVDWVGVLVCAADGNGWRLERWSSHLSTGPALGAAYCPDQSASANPLLNLDTSSPFITALRAAGCRTALIQPLNSGAGPLAAQLVFASTTPDAYGPEQIEFLRNLGGQISPAIDRTLVVEALVIAAVGGLAKLAESRDPETGDHLLRMSRYSAIVAEEFGCEPAFVRQILQFSPMHDIGKVGIADDILLKPGRLDVAEFIEMKRHPVIGGEVLRHCEDQVNAHGHSIFRIGAEIAEAHHEKFDGSGYPKGLAGAQIPLSARIVSVADVFDALTSKRPYKDAWPLDQALKMIHEGAGSHFDPAVVAAFDRALPRILAIRAQYSPAGEA